MTETVYPKRFAFCIHALLLLGWLSEKITTSSPALRSRPLETILFASLVLRAMTISSGVTRRNRARRRRVSSFPVLIFCRLSNDGSPSISFVLRYIASRTGAGDGQRLAAFMTARFGGIRNCSRTDIQNRSSGRSGVCASWAGQAASCRGSRTELLNARKREKSRRLMPVVEDRSVRIEPLLFDSVGRMSSGDRGAYDKTGRLAYKIVTGIPSAHRADKKPEQRRFERF